MKDSTGKTTTSYDPAQIGFRTIVVRGKSKRAVWQRLAEWDLTDDPVYSPHPSPNPSPHPMLALALTLLLTHSALAQAKKFSDYPNKATITNSGWLFILAETGVTNYNISFGQLTNQLWGSLPAMSNRYAGSFTGNAAGLTNHILFDYAEIQTNSVPLGSASVTNWWLGTISGIPTLVATNRAVGGWQTKALFP